MSTEPDDDALSWGDDDPSHVAGPGRGKAGAAQAPTADPGARATAGSASLVAYGIVGGVFLLYSIGWFIAVQRDTFTQPSLFGEVMYQLGEFLAIASPIIWMAAIFALVRRASTRLALLGLGVLLLVPWPFVMGA